MPKRGGHSSVAPSRRPRAPLQGAQFSPGQEVSCPVPQGTAKNNTKRVVCERQACERQGKEGGTEGRAGRAHLLREWVSRSFPPGPTLSNSLSAT